MCFCIKGPDHEHILHTAAPPQLPNLLIQMLCHQMIKCTYVMHQHVLETVHEEYPLSMYMFATCLQEYGAHLDTAGRNYAKYSEGIGANPVKILKVSFGLVHRHDTRKQQWSVAMVYAEVPTGRLVFNVSAELICNRSQIWRTVPSNVYFLSRHMTQTASDAAKTLKLWCD